MQRQSTAIYTAIAASTALSTGVIDTAEFAGGMILVPSLWTAANIGFKVCESKDGSFHILRDEFGAPVEIGSIKTDGARWYALPGALFAARYFKVWSKSSTAGAETDTNQAAERSLVVLLKS
jgi:hypothetical protein